MNNLSTKLFIFFMAISSFSYAQLPSNEVYVSGSMEDLYNSGIDYAASTDCCLYDITIYDVKVNPQPICAGDDIEIATEVYFSGWCIPDRSCFYISVLLRNSSRTAVIHNAPYTPTNPLNATIPGDWACDGTETLTYQIYDICCGKFFTKTIDLECNCCAPELDCEQVAVRGVGNDRMYFSFEPVNDPACCANPYYNIGWRVAGSNAWNYCCTSVSSTGFGVIWGLNSCTRYEFIIELKCEGTWTSPTVSECTGEFMTTGWACPIADDSPTNSFRQENVPSYSLYPNPFTEEVQISYQVENSEKVRIDVININGRLVDSLVNEWQDIGTHLVSWKGVNAIGERLPAGTYLIRIEQGNKSTVHKVLINR